MKILIVEDENQIAEMLVKSVKKWGCCPERAETGKEALNKATNNKFDLVLLDIFLPDTEGHKLIPKIRDMAPETRFIAMTAFNSKELETEVREQGIIYYLIKPFEISHLENIVKHIAGGLSNANRPAEAA